MNPIVPHFMHGLGPLSDVTPHLSFLLFPVITLLSATLKRNFQCSGIHFIFFFKNYSAQLLGLCSRGSESIERWTNTLLFLFFSFVVVVFGFVFI